MADPTKTEIAFLAMLSRGMGFNKAATSLVGDDVVKVPFNCLLNEWINRGAITQKGRDVVAKALKPTPWEITILPREKKT